MRSFKVNMGLNFSQRRGYEGSQGQFGVEFHAAKEKRGEAGRRQPSDSALVERSLDHEIVSCRDPPQGQRSTYWFPGFEVAMFRGCMDSGSK